MQQDLLHAPLIRDTTCLQLLSSIFKVHWGLSKHILCYDGDDLSHEKYTFNAVIFNSASENEHLSLIPFCPCIKMLSTFSVYWVIHSSMAEWFIYSTINFILQFYFIINEDTNSYYNISEWLSCWCFFPFLFFLLVPTGHVQYLIFYRG